MTTEAIRIAMWSGPRNISTAMMRSFENRPDSIVVDEPLYAHWLKVTGRDHPGADEVMRVHDSDWRSVVASLLAELPPGRSVFYQKHMAHHLLPEIDRSWIAGLRNVFLIREPEEMLTSLLRVVPDPSLEETGLPQQLELFRAERQHDPRGRALVIDARDVLEAPGPMLRLLCEVLEIPFHDAMLGWPAGPRASDGVWAKHWYGAVEKSRGFSTWEAKNERVPAAKQELLRRCRELYDELYRHRLTLA